MLTREDYMKTMCSFVTLRGDTVIHMLLIETLASNSLIIKHSQGTLDSKNPTTRGLENKVLASITMQTISPTYEKQAKANHNRLENPNALLMHRIKILAF